MNLPCVPLNFPHKIQDMPPKSARFCLNIKKFLVDNLGVCLDGQNILVAFSGGADSLSLLILLNILAKRAKCNIFAFHLDHALRTTSAQEALWCQDVCSKLGITFESARVDIGKIHQETSANLEELARNIRYEYLCKLADKYNCSFICTGHQLNDLAEDVLMRLLRGAGWPAIGGMQGYDPKRKILRPLLLSSRAELEDFLQEQGLSWLEDESNLETHYLRNRVRHKILPLFLEENPNFLQNIAHLWQLGRIDEAFFSEKLTGVLPVAQGGKAVLEKNTVQELDMSLRLRLYRKIIEDLGAGHPHLANIFAIDRAWFSGQFPKTVLLGGKKKAVLNNARIIWQQDK